MVKMEDNEGGVLARCAGVMLYPDVVSSRERKRWGREREMERG